MIDKKELEEIIVKFIAEYKELSKQLKLLDEVIGMTTESSLGLSIFTIIESQIELIEKIAGCKHDWLSWFVFENSCGKDSMEGGVDGDIRKIKTVNDLVWLMNLDV